MNISNKTKFQFSLVLLIIIVAVSYILFIKPNYYKFNGGKIYFETISAKRLEIGGAYDVYAYKGYLYISSRDGLKKTDYEGNSVWDKVFVVSNPELVTCNGYMSVIDVSGNYAMVFNEDGMLFDVQFDDSIIMADISEGGAVAFVLERKNQHIIKLYNLQGTLISERVTTFKKNGYPVEVELSSFGENMITSYINTNNAKVSTNVSVFDFGIKGTANAEKIIAGISYEDIFISEIEFFDDQHFVVIGDQVIEFYKLDKSVELIKRLEVKNTIKKIAIGDNSLIVNYGELILPDKEDLNNHIVVYNIYGEISDMYEVENDIETIVARDKFYYLAKYDALECYNDKKRIWTSEVYKEIDSIIKISDREFLLLNKYGYEIIRIKEI